MCRMTGVAEDTLDLVREFKRRVELRFGDRIRAVYLFGSRARGDHSPESDADAAVVFSGSVQRPFPLISQMVDDAYDLLLERGIYISPKAFAANSLTAPDTHPSPDLARTVLRDGIRV